MWDSCLSQMGNYVGLIRIVHLGPISTCPYRKHRPYMGNPSNCIGCLSCFYVDPIYIHHKLTELFHTTSRLILHWLPSVFLGGQLCGPITVAHLGPISTWQTRKHRSHLGSPPYCMGCLSCFYVDPMYIDHYLTGLFYTNSRLILQWIPTVFVDRQRCGPHTGCPPGPNINLSIQKA